MDARLIPQRYIELMSAEDRRRLQVLTQEEQMKQWKARNEKQLGNQIVQYLQLRGIEVIRNRTDKKSTANKGLPDLLFSVRSGSGIPMACAFELKTDTGVLSRAQNDMMQRMKSAPNAWHVRVIRNFMEVVDFCREVGI